LFNAMSIKYIMSGDHVHENYSDVDVF